MTRRQALSAYHVYLLFHGGLELLLALIWGVNLVYQVEKVGLNPLQLVLVGTALELSMVLFEVPTGVIADVYSRRLSIIVGTLILGVGFVLMGAVPIFWVILVSQAIAGIGYTCLSGAEQAWITDELGEERAARAFVRGAQVGHAGRILGVLGAVVLGSIALQLPIVTGGALIAVLGVFLILAMPERGFRPAPRENRTTWHSMQTTFLAGTALVRQRPILLTMLGIAAFFGMYNEGFDRLWSAHLLENFSLPHIGPLEPLYWWAVIGIAIDLLGLVAMEVMRRRLNMNSHQAVTRTLIAINVLLVGAVLAFALAGSFPLALVLLIGGAVLREAIYPLKNAWLNQSVESHVRATLFSMHGQADAVGQIAGGPAIGSIGTVFSLRAALVAAGAMLAPGLLLYARALGQEHRAPTIHEETSPAD